MASLAERLASLPAEPEALRPFAAALDRLRGGFLHLIEFDPHCPGGDVPGPSRAWRAAFPHAHVVSVRPDMPPAAAVTGPPWFTLIAARQDDHHALETLVGHGPPSLVADAATQPWEHRRDAVAALLPTMPPGGVYALRDPDGGDPLGAMIDAVAARRQAPAPDLAAHAGLLARCCESIVRVDDLLLLLRNANRLPVARPVRPLAEVADVLWALDTGGAYRRLPAELVDCPDWLVRRFAAMAPPGHEVPAFPGHVGALSGALVHGRGLVISRGGAVLRESLINARHAPKAAGFLKIEGGRRYLPPPGPAPAPRPLEGAPRVLLKQEWDNNYGHWLIESLPRAALAARIARPAACRFLVHAEAEPMRRVYLESLAPLGVTEAQVEFTTGAALAVEHLIYPAPLTCQPWVKAPFVIDLLAGFPARLGVADRDAPRRLYVTRGPGQRRRLVNEEEVLALLRPRGFTVVDPSDLDFRAQVAIFARAEIVVGILGAGLANLAFAPRGVSLVALTTELMGDDFFYDLICHKGGRYVSIHGRAADAALGMNADFAIDPRSLLPYLP